LDMGAIVLHAVHPVAANKRRLPEKSYRRAVIETSPPDTDALFDCTHAERAVAAQDGEKDEDAPLPPTGA